MMTKSVGVLGAVLLLAGCGSNAALDNCQAKLIELAGKVGQQPGGAATPCPQCPQQQQCPQCPDSPQVITQVNDQMLAQLVRQAGFQVIDSPGPGRVRFNMEGIKVLIHHGNGTNLQLYAAFVADVPPALGAINEWNRTKRYSRAYVDADGDPVIESDIDIKGGVQPQVIVDFIKVFRISVFAYRGELLKERST